MLDKAQLKAFGKTVTGGHSISIPPLYSKEPLGGHQRAVVLNEALVKTTNSQKNTDIIGGGGVGH